MKEDFKYQIGDLLQYVIHNNDICYIIKRTFHNHNHFHENTKFYTIKSAMSNKIFEVGEDYISAGIDLKTILYFKQ